MNENRIVGSKIRLIQREDKEGQTVLAFLDIEFWNK